MADNFKAAATAAGLTSAQQKKLEDFNKSLAVHKNLSNLPSDVANQVYNNLDPSQKAAQIQNFGNEDPAIKPSRGWLGTAWHYTGGQVGNAIGYVGSKTLAGLGNVSDAMTRAYRTAAIAIDQDVSIGTAFDIANDKGDKVFSPGRIGEAKSKWGNDAVSIAIRIASGEKPEEIFKSATPEQQKYIMLADPRQTNIPGISPDDIICYSELKKFKTITDLLPTDKSFKIILLEWDKNKGHFVGIMRDNDKYEYFNSLGYKYDADLFFIDKNSSVILVTEKLGVASSNGISVKGSFVAMNIVLHIFVRLADNGLQLQEVGDFEALNCLPALNLKRSTKLHLTTEPPISCRCC